MSATQVGGHYVYLYKDQKGKAQYVGYGHNPERAERHATESHNEELRLFLEANRYSLEIAGPFGSEECGRAVETALISALAPLCNVDPGQHVHRFRPVGVPLAFASRLVEPPLTRQGFVQAVHSNGRTETIPPLLFVYINGQDFGDGRRGHDPANPPTNEELLERMDRWWQLKSYLAAWNEEPDRSPSLLIAVAGQPKSRIVIGAVKIDQVGWDASLCEGALCQVPICSSTDLDAYGFRGRRIDPDSHILFGAFRHQQFLFLHADGEIEGGRAPLNKAVE